MYEDPEENPTEQASDPAERAREKATEFRMHAELCAVFEGPRKFDATLLTDLDADAARDIQRTIGKLEKAKTPESPILPEETIAEAGRLLDFPKAAGLTTNDYHIYRRPGEIMVVRWLQGEEIESFYQRLQAHFDAALEGFREDERQAHEWRQDTQIEAYLAAIDKISVSMKDIYLRDLIRQHNLFVLSTQAADELNILHLTDYIMGISAADLVGDALAPDESAIDQEKAWFFKLFSLRGMQQGEERACLFAYLQKSDDSW